MPIWKQPSALNAAPPAGGVNAPEILPPSTPIAATLVSPAAPPTILGRTVELVGEITGSESIYLDGQLEGVIHVPGERVTIGPHGRIVNPRLAGRAPCIVAREIIVLGSVIGSVMAEDRTEIRSSGSLTGDISTVRVSIEDGAYFHGGIDLRKSTTVSAAVTTAPLADGENVGVSA